MTFRLKAAAANVALAVLSTAVCYVVLEAAFFRLALPNLSLNVRSYLPEMADVLIQNSKAGALPHDYVAVLGDSYAEGVGDWLWANNGNRAKPFHSANVVHELTGRDVVSFGKVGAGSAEGLVLRPARIFGGSHCAIMPSLENPSRIVAYFYEGNDVEDNLVFLDKVRRRYGTADAAAVDRFLSEQYGSYASWRCHTHLFDTMARMAKFAWYYHFSKEFEPDRLFRREPGANSFVVGGRAVGAPGPIEGPALDRSNEEIRAGIEVFDRSLLWLRNRFPDVPVTVVYIPSPLAAYRQAAATVAFSTQHDGRNLRFPSERVGEASNRICGLVRAATLRRGAGFVDARPALREAASGQLIHGPLDWGHPNEAGYRALGGLVAKRLEGDTAADACKGTDSRATAQPPSRNGPA